MNYRADDMANLRLDFGGRCQNPQCNAPHSMIRGKKGPLEFAHREPGEPPFGEGRGLNVRYLDIRKNPKKYILLCKRCHKIYDLKGGQFWDPMIPVREKGGEG